MIEIPANDGKRFYQLKRTIFRQPPTFRHGTASFFNLSSPPNHVFAFFWLSHIIAPPPMAKSAPKSEPQLDILVLGEHPASYLCAAILRVGTKLRVVHSTIPQEVPVDRICLLNPALFSLHKLLEPIKRKLDLTALYGLQFLADEADTA